MKEQTKAQMSAEIDRLNGVISYYMEKPRALDYEVYITLSDLLDRTLTALRDDLVHASAKLSDHGVIAINDKREHLEEAFSFIRDIPKTSQKGDLLIVQKWGRL